MGVSLADRFWAKVALTADDTRCWEWQAGRRKSKRPYGRFGFYGRNENAHRVAWFLTHNRMPNGLVRHTCDNPPCVNPNHLLEGTHADNAHDMVERNRQSKGEHRPSAKLSEGAVRAIRRLVNDGVSRNTLAAMYGVGRTAIFDIQHGLKWKHIT